MAAVKLQNLLLAFEIVLLDVAGNTRIGDGFAGPTCSRCLR